MFLKFLLKAGENYCSAFLRYCYMSCMNYPTILTIPPCPNLFGSVAFSFFPVSSFLGQSRRLLQIISQGLAPYGLRTSAPSLSVDVRAVNNNQYLQCCTELDVELKVTKMSMFRWAQGNTKPDKIPSEKIHYKQKAHTIDKVCSSLRLMYGQVQKREIDHACRSSLNKTNHLTIQLDSLSLS